MKISGIYKIQSIIKPERCYIGSAVNVSERWRLHLLKLKQGLHRSQKLQRHYNKYGKDDLQFLILIGCDKENLISSEQFFIDSYKPYFNNRPIAQSNLGCKWSEETKKKTSNSLMGNIPWNKGISPTEETKKKQSDSMCGKISWNKGIPCREETKEKIRNTKTLIRLNKLDLITNN